MLGSEKFRTREKRLLVQELLRPGQKLSGGSKYLIFKQIFRSAKIRLWDPKCCRSRKKDCWIRKGVRTHETVRTHGKRLPALKMLICLKRSCMRIWIFKLLLEYSDPWKDCRIHRKWIVEPRKLQGSEEKSAGSGNVGPLKKLMCGSKHLNCRWVFGSAKRLVDP